MKSKKIFFYAFFLFFNKAFSQSEDSLFLKIFSHKYENYSVEKKKTQSIKTVVLKSETKRWER